MSIIPKKNKPQNLAKPSSSQTPSHGDFDVVLGLIEAARTRAVAAVNTTLIDLYWSVGEFISLKIAKDGWGQGTVKQLADYIQEWQPNARGFSSQNLWRMRQFYETYRDRPILSTLSRELPWKARSRTGTKAGLQTRWRQRPGCRCLGPNRLPPGGNQSTRSPPPTCVAQGGQSRRLRRQARR